MKKLKAREDNLSTITPFSRTRKATDTHIPGHRGAANTLTSISADFQEHDYPKAGDHTAQPGSVAPGTRDPYAPPTHVLCMVWKSCWPSRETPALIA